VPTFIINERYGVVGAQEYEVFERVMEELGVPKKTEG
jgi:predicted DsbA family dithiol-disulfide isomerase